MRKELLFGFSIMALVVLLTIVLMRGAIFRVGILAC